MNRVQKTIIQVIDWFYRPFRNLIPNMTFRYAACGGANTVLDILLYFLTYHYILNQELLDFGFVAISAHIAAFLLVFPITFSSGFLLAKYITFTQSQLKGRVQLFRYALSVSGSILLNYILIKFFVEYCELYATPSKIITTGIVIVYSYYVQKLYTFKVSSLEKA